MRKWRRMSIKQKREYILSVYGSAGEMLTASEIAQRLRRQGVQPPNPQELGMFMRAYMEFKYLEKIREHRKITKTYWKRLS